MSSRRPIKVGFFVPAQQGGMADGALRWADIRAMALRAEEIGFDSFWLPDHLITRHPGQPTSGPWECWSLLCALAASTSKIELGTGVICTGFRNPALLAKMADTLDEISGGRLILGLGAGWHEPEFTAFGYPFDHRVGRFEEATQIITKLLRTGQVDFTGEYYTARECELR
ncbi:MAG: LLM class flavin-dependent oxidoreductase, partial [Thermomicrobiales bacterium]